MVKASLAKASLAKAKRKTKADPVKASKSKVKTAAGRWPRQHFTVSHLREEDFDPGLRPYSAYRDLGLAPATGGKVQAHVIRMTKPFDRDKVAIPHYHDVEFQMVYVLRGWFSSQFEGHGTHTFKAGSCWLLERLRAPGDHPAGRVRHRDARQQAQASSQRPPVTTMKMTAVAPSTVVICRQPRPAIVSTEVPSPSAPIASSRPQLESSTSTDLAGA